MADLEIFSWCIRPDFTVENEPNVFSANFGDGYKQLSPKGLNSLMRDYSVVVKVKNAEAIKVDAFLVKHNAVKSFYFNDPYTGTKRKVRCRKWTAKQGLEYTEITLELEDML